MQDSDDDYFADDLVLDDKTLAVLDEEESKFRRATNTQTQQTASPPAKRQKTTASWKPQSVGRPIQRTDTVDDTEDLPDVSIRQDGTYGLRDKQRRVVSGPTAWSGNASGSNGVVRAGSVPRPAVAAPLARGAAPSMRRTTVTGSVRPTPVSSRPPPSARGTQIAQSPVSSQDVSRPRPVPSQRVDKNVPSTTTSNVYVEQLLQQIEELRKKNETIRAEMESAREAKFAKEGEVTILRKRMEKTAQDHSAQIAKLHLAKEEADAKHVSLQKQFEADKERLKTELTFKRHELESSAWRQAAPHSPKKSGSQTAGPLPSQRQRPSQWGSPGPSRLAPEIPRHPRFGVISNLDKPQKSTALDTRDLPSGFQTGPLRSQSMVGRRGKETTSSNAPFPPPAILSVSPASQRSSSQFQHDIFSTQLNDIGLVEAVDDSPPHADVGIDDVQMVDGTPVMTLSSQENTAVLSLPSWSLILHDTILTHTSQGSNLPTLQMLISVCPADGGQLQSYSAALMRIFDMLGGIPANPDSDFDHVARTICYALCEITHLLAKNNLIPPLTAILNLLTNLAYMLPSVHIFLISQCAPDHNKTLPLLQVLHYIIQHQLQKLDVAAGNEPPELCSLGKETLSLYEALLWWASDDCEDRIEASSSACPDMPSLFTTLLHPNRPSWFLVGGVRILIWLSTRRSLSRSLLSYIASERPTNSSKPTNLDHHPQISLACSLLTDAGRQGPEADELKSCIITFFGIISNAHPDAYTLLVESPELIPSIVLYLCHTVPAIWHENRAVLKDTRAVTRTVHVINYATLLLHHLVSSEDAALDLRERLLRAPPSQYRGLVHSFILAFGRLSYANPPYWLAEKDRDQLAGVADLARALLERVIQGPELDLIWGTYQDDEDETSETAMDVDDEEAEARQVA